MLETNIRVRLITAERLHRRQELRKQLLRNTCDREEFAEGKRSLEDMSDKQLENLIVDDKHGIIYCYIPKVMKTWTLAGTLFQTTSSKSVISTESRSYLQQVACTNWKKVFLVLKQGQPYQDPMSIPSENVHHKINFALLNGFPRPEIKVSSYDGVRCDKRMRWCFLNLKLQAKLKHYTKFLYVRDPFVRLISAYRDKFQKENEYFYHLYGRDILRTYANQADPPETAHEAFASGIHVSFYNFIQYLLDPQTVSPFEPHWRQMDSLCHPCIIQYGHFCQQGSTRFFLLFMYIWMCIIDNETLYQTQMDSRPEWCASADVSSSLTAVCFTTQVWLHRPSGDPSGGRWTAAEDADAGRPHSVPSFIRKRDFPGFCVGLDGHGAPGREEETLQTVWGGLQAFWLQKAIWTAWWLIWSHDLHFSLRRQSALKPQYLPLYASCLYYVSVDVFVFRLFTSQAYSTWSKCRDGSSHWYEVRLFFFNYSYPDWYLLGSLVCEQLAKCMK